MLFFTQVNHLSSYVDAYRSTYPCHVLNEKHVAYPCVLKAICMPSHDRWDQGTPSSAIQPLLHQTTFASNSQVAQLHP